MSTTLNYPYTISPTGVVTPTGNPSKIYLDKVLTLLSTNVGQRPMTPEYGVDWELALFENEGNAAKGAYQAIKVAIATWLPEVEVKDIEISFDSLSGIETVTLSLRLPDDTMANLAINSDIINYYGTITR